MLNEEIFATIKNTITTPIVNECLNLQNVNLNYKVLIGGFLNAMNEIANQFEHKFVTDEQKNDYKLLKSIVKDYSSFIEFLHEIIRRNNHLKLTLIQAFFYVQSCVLGMFNEGQTLNNQTGNLYYKNALILKVDGVLKSIVGIPANELKSPFPRIEASYRAIKLWRLRKTLATMCINCNWQDLVIGNMIIKINKLVWGYDNLLSIDLNRNKIAHCHYFGDSRFQYSFFGYIGELEENAKNNSMPYFFMFDDYSYTNPNNLLDLFI